MKIAMMQMLVQPGMLTDNLNHAAELLERVRDNDVSVAVFPECCDIGWTCQQAHKLARPVPGETVMFLQEAAKRENVYVAAGITERDGEQLYNTAVFISSTGELLGKHRKIHLLHEVEGLYSIGDTLRVYNTPFGRIGLNICADNSINSVALGSSLGLMGADVILSPSSWAVPPTTLGTPYGREWYEPYTILTTQFPLTIVGVSNVGPVRGGAWSGWSCIGNSIAMGPGGNVIAVLPYGEQEEEIRFIEV